MAASVAPYELIIEIDKATTATPQDKVATHFRAVASDPQVVNDDQRIIRFIGTTTDEDRYGDVVESKGAALDNYVKNPVFLWGHNHSEPAIGKCVRLKVTDTSIIFDIQFADTVKALEIYKLYKGKFMRAVSIGFIPLEDPEQRESEVYTSRGGYTFKRWELLELSAVTIPANPNALSNNFKAMIRAYAGIAPRTKATTSATGAGADGTSVGAVADAVLVPTDVDLSAALDAIWADEMAPAGTKPAQDHEAAEKPSLDVGNTTVAVDGVNDEEPDPRAKESGAPTASEEDKKNMESMVAKMASLEGLVQSLTSALQNKGLGVSVKGALPYAKHALAPIATPWSTSQAKARDAAFFRKSMAEGRMERYALAFAYVTPGEEAKAESYKFLHHDIVKGVLSTNFRGVANAMVAVLSSTLDAPAKKAAYSHLAAHYKEFGKIAPAFKSYGPEDQGAAVQACFNPKSMAAPAAKGPSATSDKEPYEDGDGPSDADPYPEDDNKDPATPKDKVPGQEDKDAVDPGVLSDHLCKVMKSLGTVQACMKDFHNNVCGFEPYTGEEDKAEDGDGPEDGDSDETITPDSDAPAEANDEKPEDKEIDPDAPVDPNAKA